MGACGFALGYQEPFEAQIVVQSCQLRQVLALAATKAKRVVLITPPNPGYLAILPWVLRRLYARRSLRVGRIFAEETARYPQVRLLNMLAFTGKELADLPSLMAPDLVHPNDAGYAWAFAQVRPML